MADFVKRFSLLRENRSKSYVEIAKEIGISLRALKYYAAGERQPTVDTLIALADYFDVSLDYLCGRSEIKERR